MINDTTIVGDLSKCRGQHEVDEAKQYYDYFLTCLTTNQMHALELYVKNKEKYNIGISEGWFVDKDGVLSYSIKWVDVSNYVPTIAEDIYFPHPIKIIE